MIYLVSFSLVIEGTALSAEIEENIVVPIEGPDDVPPIYYDPPEGDTYKNTIRVDKVYRVKENVS